MKTQNLGRFAAAGSAALWLFALGIAPAAAQDTGFYVGAGVGQATTDLCDDLGIGGVNCDDTDTGMKIFGGYKFNPNFGIEAGLVDLGEVSITGPGGTATIEVDGFQFAAVGVYPINPKFSMFGKLGLYMWDASFSAPGFSESDDGTDLTFGVGVAWNFMRNLSLRGEWERFDLDDVDADLLSASIVFTF